MERMQAKARARYRLAEFLGKCGKRCTPERLAILDIALDQRGAFSGEELLAQCQPAPGGITVCRATLFNTLPLLLGAGIICQNSLDHRYQVVRQAVKPRLALICTVCGKVYHRRAPGFAEWLTGQDLRGFSPTENGAEINVYGECSKCHRKLK